MVEFMNRHKIRPIVDKVFEFSEAKEAFSYLDSQQHFGKVVIRVNSDTGSVVRRSSMGLFGWLVQVLMLWWMQLFKLTG